MNVLAKKLAKLPHSPGIYLFKDKSGGVIYVGKSGNLKNRVRSYFPAQGGPASDRFNPVKVKMLSEIADIEILRTESEIEA
ncbi:MAG: GIY-YIG nuclease family protein, partial [Candidatus Sungbacteria bacterium]|nr:GIY-YIG nuclease family protein [Candidatus Sungbacteria bacterium]